MTLWLILFLAGLLTFAIRFSFLANAERFDLQPALRRMLRFVPVAVLTALFVPDLIYRQQVMAFSIENHRLLAGLLAIVVAWVTRNTLLTIAAGMMALWLLQTFLG